MADLVEKLRFVASGQDDVQSQAITAAADEIERLRSALLDIADAARLSPYREAGAWDDSLAKLIARRVEFLRP